jgi:Flp pilus assembly protein TadG
VQRGSTAVEFAIVFPLFFLVFYAIVTYSMIFVAQQSLTLAASEGARAALRFQSNATSAASALALRASAACTTATGLVNWLASSTPCTATYAPCTFDATMQCVNVALNYNYASQPLVPSLPLIGLPLPANLAASAMVQLNPENLF